MLEKLNKHDEWINFYNKKILEDHLNQKQANDLKEFIDNKQYLEIAKNINNYAFSYPKKTEISKLGKSKKRVIYMYPRNENYILKFISSKLHKYDYIFSSNLYSYRNNNCVKDAIRNIAHTKDINNMYVYKVDISNYFNSINIDILLDILVNILSDDKDLYNLIKNILTNKYVIFKENIIEEDKGIMCGVPISSFLANVYLIEIDKYFEENNIMYYRYADDIIIFSNTIDKLNEYISVLKKYLEKYKLTINKDKENYYKPNEKFEFLGFSFYDNKIDLSSSSIKKIKGKIKRSARGIRRWMVKNNAKEEYALKAMNRKFNNKFYNIKDSNDLNWSLWYFPVINTTNSLKIIDKYMQENLRYIVCGKYSKKNYKKVSYYNLKKCNYKPLVHEYYEYNKIKLIPLKECINIKLYQMYQDIPKLEMNELNELNGITYDEFKNKCKEYIEEEKIQNSNINTTTNRYILVYKGNYIGVVGIRTTLSDFWCNKGSQIFYKIALSKRRKGYGTLILSLALKEARKLGFTQVRVNCSNLNIASNKIIQKNGGILDIKDYKTKYGLSSSYIIKI